MQGTHRGVCKVYGQCVWIPASKVIFLLRLVEGFAPELPAQMITEHPGLPGYREYFCCK